MPHVINSRALTSEKPCINKAIHALLMHGYATFNVLVPGPPICCRYEMYTVRPYNEHSPWKLRSRDIGENAKQNSARNNAKCSKCFQFLCNNSDRTWFFNALKFVMVFAIIVIKHGFFNAWRMSMQVRGQLYWPSPSGLGSMQLPRTCNWANTKSLD